MAKPLPPLCRWCGKAIPKKTRTLHFEATEHPSHKSVAEWADYSYGPRPATKAEAQTRTNALVVSVQRVGYGTDATLIRSVGTWDGESYRDPYFCNGDHARSFGYMMAKEHPRSGTGDWVIAWDRQRQEAANG